MMQARIRTLAIAAMLGVALVVAVLYVMERTRVHAPPPPPASLARLVPAKKAHLVPAVAFDSRDGKRVSLAALRGRYVLLNLWAVWCAPCVKELPALARLQRAARSARFEVVAVDVARGTAADAAAFLKSHDASALEPFIDPHLTLMRAFGAYGLPMTVLIDDQGREIARAMGPADWDAPESIAWFRSLGGDARS